ncbi:cytochrome c3 family protein [Candidatus Methanoperedens nitratireducens]|uniref:Putative Cytochrome c n=1 Tax=Candidatus Methanoperedens nitratireducens TaxID=1392998 RepID=A0A284VP41_9EURY|nr:cytochrome c3 family protein [Candidatus Methanoperedens nitroreducens]SNQ60988.1 putative Cytochrome c [Candidatus Methanoperedens nitroreducens]
MRKIMLILIPVLVIALIWTAFANVPPPPVNQNVSAYDTSVTELKEQNCRGCHTQGVQDRHHGLAQTGEYYCKSCHPIQNTPTGQKVLLDRNCIDCHNGSAFFGNISVIAGRPHHNTSWAQARNCKQCHGGFVDNYNDGHYMPDYGVSLVTPDTSYKVINSTSGRKWGGCEACHDVDASAIPQILPNFNTHHNTILGVTQGYQCEWCHIAQGTALDIRKCEDCHSISTIHNIEYDYANNSARAGYGHIGDNWDCNGCHAYWDAGESGFEGAIIPNLVTINPIRLTTNVPTTLTLEGSDFLSGTATYTAQVVIDDAINLTPTTVTDSKIVVDVTLPAGVHTIKVVKNGDFVPKPSQLKSLTVVDPVDVTSAIITNLGNNRIPTEITITGIGFGEQPDPLFTDLGVFVSSNRKTETASIVSWTDTQIVATVKTSVANIGADVTVKALFGQDTEPLQ